MLNLTFAAVECLGLPIFYTKEADDTFDNTGELCPICYESSAGDVVKTSCDHVFHESCIRTWLQQLELDMKQGT